MKLSCLPVSFFKDIISGAMSPGEWASSASKLGLDAIDMSILMIRNRTPVYLKKLAEEISGTEMKITMITTYPDFTNPSEIQRKREMAYLVSDIAVAGQLNAGYLRITAGQDYRYDGPDADRILGIVSDSFSEAEKQAAIHGVKLVFENHSKPGAWERPDFLFPTQNFLKLAGMMKLKRSSVKINFDTANTLAYGDDPVEVFKSVLPQVETIHVSDIKAAGGIDFTVIGEGAAPVREILGMAKAAGFDGWVCIEEASGTGIDGVAKAVDFVREAWAKA
ncbi:MAG: sugar phosphate isomerase/epimerase [Eubacteriales bacterium]|nr:sugar phosphate isomerase/epimerase [Eubacteriales bacterium]